MGPGDEALPGLPAGDGAAGGVRALRVPWQSEASPRLAPLGLGWEGRGGPRESTTRVNLKFKSQNERQQAFIWHQRIVIWAAQIQAETQIVSRLQDESKGFL